MLSCTGETSKTPGSNGTKFDCLGSFTRANAMPSSDNSKACVGGGSFSRLASEVMTGWTSSFDERHLVNLLERCYTGAHFLDRGFTQKPHPLFARYTFDLRRRALVQDHFANPLAQVEQFVDRGSSAESRSSAFETAWAFIEREISPLVGLEAAFEQVLIR